MNEEAQDQAKAAGGRAPQADGRLCAAAEMLLGWEDAAAEPPESLLNFISWSSGLPSRIPGSTTAVFETEEPKEIAARLAEPIARFSKTAIQPLYGVAMQRLRKSATRVVLISSTRPPSTSVATTNGGSVAFLSR